MKRKKIPFACLAVFLILFFAVRIGEAQHTNRAAGSVEIASAPPVRFELLESANDAVSQPQEDTAESKSVFGYFEDLGSSIAQSFRIVAAEQSESAAEPAAASAIQIEIDEDEMEDITHRITIDVEAPQQKSDLCVLIYHTHLKEAYSPAEYVPCGSFMTAQEEYNMASVGQTLAQTLEQEGADVIHDTTDNEAEPYSASYDKSLETMLMQQDAHPQINMFIDLHRDYIDDFDYAANDVVVQDGKTYARIMFVVGTGEGKNYTGDELPDWQSNYALAQAVTEQLNSMVPGVARDVMVKKGRYNQHVSDCCMLAEVGYSANTLEEARNSAELLGRAIAAVLK